MDGHGQKTGGKAAAEDVGARRAAMRAGVPLRSVVGALLAFYLVAGVLNGRQLHEGASRRVYGGVRDAWMAALAPWRAAGDFLHAGRLYDAAVRLREMMDD